MISWLAKTCQQWQVKPLRSERKSMAMWISLLSAVTLGVPLQCPVPCSSSNGVCTLKHSGQYACECYPGFTGSSCAERACPSNCSSHGTCVDGSCRCEPTFTGLDCSLYTCPNGCSNNGHCDAATGVCRCRPGFLGADCSSRRCPADCGGHGRCVDGTCECDQPWFGPSCAEKSCDTDCHHRGSCINGRCACHDGAYGTACELTACPNGCSEHGVCKANGVCECLDGWTSTDCSVRAFFPFLAASSFSQPFFPLARSHPSFLFVCVHSPLSYTGSNLQEELLEPWHMQARPHMRMRGRLERRILRVAHMPEWLLWPRALPRGRVPLRARPVRRGLLEGPLPKLVLRPRNVHRVGQVRV